MHFSADVTAAAVDPHPFRGAQIGRACSPSPSAAGQVHEQPPEIENTGNAVTESAVTFTDLPENVRSKIFGFLDNSPACPGIVTDRKNARAVNRDARRLISESVRTFIAADAGTYGCADDLARVLAAFPNLRNVDLTAHRTTTDMQIRALRKAARLEVLDIRGLYKLTNKSVDIIASLPRLHTLIARYCPAFGSPASIRRLAGAPHLETVDLSQNARVDDDALRQLASAPSLRTLKLSQCRNISANGVANLTQSPKLRTIDLSHNFQLYACDVDRQFALRPEIDVQLRGCPSTPDDAVAGIRRVRAAEQVA